MRRIKITVPLSKKGGAFEIENYTIFINPIESGTSFIVTLAEFDNIKKGYNLEVGHVSSINEDGVETEYDSVWFKKDDVGVFFHFDEETVGFVVGVPES